MWRKFIFALALAVLVVPMAALQPASALTVSPVIIEFDVKPGETVVGTIKLKNESESTATYYATVQDFVAGDSAGTPAFIGKSKTRSLVDWTTFDKTTVALGGGDSDLVIYRIRVPEGAAPGGYFGGLLFSSSSPDAEGVGAVAMTGPLVLLRVAGAVVERGSLLSYGVKPESTTSLPVDFTMDFQNSGTVHLKPQGVVRVTNMFGGTSAVVPVNAAGGNVLPDSNRVFSAKWMKAELPDNASELVKEWKNFGFGPYTATLIMNYGESNQVVSAEASFWVMPWMLVVLFIILLVVIALLVMQYNKWIVARAVKKK
ncbi:DUF916 domain-containing protein [Patescibacteria group bacterium]|nr:DUF916 domain-containing protein [Patescibacteria group bacterium]